jgi:hypothetical protein
MGMKGGIEENGGTEEVRR